MAVQRNQIRLRFAAGLRQLLPEGIQRHQSDSSQRSRGAATARSVYHLPLYATECNGYYYWKGNHPENPAAHYVAGWMQEIYAEINRYNQSAVLDGKPIFRCINMYRWCANCDGWNIDGTSDPYLGQILSDLDAAVAQ